MPAEEAVETQTLTPTLTQAPDITITNACLAFANKPIFSGINLHIPAKHWVALLGPSGVGKSSFLRLIAGLNTAQENSQAIISTSNHLPIQQQIAYMAQSDLLLPWMTVLNNAMLGAKLRATLAAKLGSKLGSTLSAKLNAKLNLKLRPKLSTELDSQTHNQQNTLIQHATLLLKQVGLENALDLYPHQLSGGMRQRLALVRTLMENKPIVLMDEPFSALDAITRYKLQDLCAELLKNKTVLFITHDPTEALRLAHTIYIMQDQPANLKAITTLSSPAPRNIAEREFTTLQALLFNELAQAAGNDLSPALENELEQAAEQDS
jgi:putative hydroxymethylpyrimidine transport system ATP-binding protein